MPFLTYPGMDPFHPKGDRILFFCEAAAHTVAVAPCVPYQFGEEKKKERKVKSHANFRKAGKKYTTVIRSISISLIEEKEMRLIT